MSMLWSTCFYGNGHIQNVDNRRRCKIHMVLFQQINVIYLIWEIIRCNTSIFQNAVQTLQTKNIYLWQKASCQNRYSEGVREATFPWNTRTSFRRSNKCRGNLGVRSSKSGVDNSTSNASSTDGTPFSGSMAKVFVKKIAISLLFLRWPSIGQQSSSAWIIIFHTLGGVYNEVAPETIHASKLHSRP